MLSLHQGGAHQACHFESWDGYVLLNVIVDFSEVTKDIKRETCDI